MIQVTYNLNLNIIVTMNYLRKGAEFVVGLIGGITITNLFLYIVLAVSL